MAQIKALISPELTRHGTLRQTERSLQDSTEQPTSIRILHLVYTGWYLLVCCRHFVEGSG